MGVQLGVCARGLRFGLDLRMVGHRCGGFRVPFDLQIIARNATLGDFGLGARVG